MKLSKKIFGLLLGMLLTVSTFANGVVTYTDAANAEKSKSTPDLKKLAEINAKLFTAEQQFKPFSTT